MTRHHHSYLTVDEIPMPYCPGCGHTGTVRAIDRALVKLQLDPTKTVIVTDIGCIGLADRNFKTNAFHGLHGRSITYACGLKLANPDLDVITIMGDGACGIGGTHLLNVARRNIGITLIIANNMNYGMTGGQHSVTTPCQAITSTTPLGNIEKPMNICATAAAAGASWVHRSTAFDKDLPDAIAEAIQEPGFSMLEIWELCTAYYAPANDVKKKELMALLDKLAFATGRIVHEPRAEYGRSYRETYAFAGLGKTPRQTITPYHSSPVDKQTGILIAGAAGQKVKSASTILACAAIASDLHATQKDDYPITIMTGHSISELIFSQDPIDYTGLDKPEHVLLLSQEGIARAHARIAALPETSTIYADEKQSLPDTAARIERFPFATTAKKVGRFSLVYVGIGAMLRHTQMLSLAAVSEMIAARQGKAVATVNSQALAAGAQLGERAVH